MSRQLTAVGMEAIAKRRAFVHEHLPEAVPFIQELHGFGMIDGWRNVSRVGPAEEQPTGDGRVVTGPFLTGRELIGKGRK